jgi:hypothetical protein
MVDYFTQLIGLIDWIVLSQYHFYVYEWGMGKNQNITIHTQYFGLQHSISHPKLLA